MNTTLPLTGSHRRTYDTIFQHPIAQNLQWRDVNALLEEIGHVAQEPNGHLKVTRNGQTMVLHPPRTKDFSDADELMDLRHFLELSEMTTAATEEKDVHWLLVIDHREARIFRTEMHGTAPQRILPHAPDEYFRHAKHSKEISRGKEKPDPNSFFEPVAKALQAAGHILIFGTGTGTSSEMEQFIAWSKKHHPELARRFIASLTVDEHHLTDDQLLAKAREFYGSAQASPV
jgi:hypothetical protein